LEDVGEATYRLDRMLMQLKLQRDFSKLKGIVFGGFTNCEVQPPECSDREVFTLLKDFSDSCKFPVFSGFPCGHVEDPVILPIGGYAEIDRENCSLTIPF
jgi:muramoyltetrapeptide carboxypeptidase